MRFDNAGDQPSYRYDSRSQTRLSGKLTASSRHSSSELCLKKDLRQTSIVHGSSSQLIGNRGLGSSPFALLTRRFCILACLNPQSHETFQSSTRSATQDERP